MSISRQGDPVSGTVYLSLARDLDPSCGNERSRKAGERESKDLCIFFLRIGKPLSRQVLPCRIPTDNQLHLLDSCPALQLLFASYGCVYIFERLPIHQPVKFVSAAEAFERTCLVLKDAFFNIVGNADVKSHGAVCHDVHVEPFF